MVQLLPLGLSQGCLLLSGLAGYLETRPQGGRQPACGLPEGRTRCGCARQGALDLGRVKGEGGLAWREPIGLTLPRGEPWAQSSPPACYSSLVLPRHGNSWLLPALSIAQSLACQEYPCKVTPWNRPRQNSVFSNKQPLSSNTSPVPQSPGPQPGHQGCDHKGLGSWGLRVAERNWEA